MMYRCPTYANGVHQSKMIGYFHYIQLQHGTTRSQDYPCTGLGERQMYCGSYCHQGGEQQSYYQENDQFDSLQFGKPLTIDKQQIKQPKPPDTTTSPKHVCGLPNVGNTCYLNAALQLAFRMPPITSAIQKYVQQTQASTSSQNQWSPTQSGALVSAIGEVLVQYDQGSVDRRAMVKVVQDLGKVNGQFQAGGQHDAAECLGLILDSILQANQEGSMYLQNGVGILWQQQIQCLTCGDLSIRDIPELYTILHVSDIQGSVSLQAALQKHMQQEVIDDAQCEECKAVGKGKQIYPKQTGQFIILNINRFVYDMYGNTVKCNTPIHVNNQLYINVNGIRHTYVLEAMINHAGSINMGHYTNQVYSQDAWFNIDDILVEVQQQDMDSSAPYICLYQLQQLHQDG